MVLLAGELPRNKTDDVRLIRYQNRAGEQVELPLNPRRVVVAYGSLVRVWALAGGTVVGVPQITDNNLLPEKWRELPVIGSATLPNIEKILTLEPDLVILASKVGRHQRAAEVLTQAGVTAVCVDYDNYRDFAALLKLFCELNSQKLEEVPEARKVMEHVSEICREAQVQAAQRTLRSAVVFASAAGFALESEQTNTGMMLEMLGTENILKVSGHNRVPFSYEKLLLEDPEVIFIITMGDEQKLQEKFDREFRHQPAWNSLQAARNNRVHYLPAKWFLYTPAQEFPEAFEYLFNLLYSENREGSL